MSGFAFTSRSCSNEPPLASTWMVASTAAMPTSPPFLDFNQCFNERSHDPNYRQLTVQDKAAPLPFRLTQT